MDDKSQSDKATNCKILAFSIKPHANQSEVNALSALPENARIELSTGESLGLVHSVSIKAKAGEITTATIETYCTKAEAEILQRNTDLKITVLNDKRQISEDLKDLIREAVISVICDERRAGGLLKD